MGLLGGALYWKRVPEVEVGRGAGMSPAPFLVQAHCAMRERGNKKGSGLIGWYRKTVKRDALGEYPFRIVLAFSPNYICAVAFTKKVHNLED